MVKKIVRIVCAVLILVYIIIFISYIYPHVLKDKGQIKDQSQVTILKLWHVDVFEGGSGSRADFLRRIAIAYEKANVGTFVMVEALTLDQLKDNLAIGKQADLISYGGGIANSILPKLQSFTGTFTAYSEFIDSGMIENKVYGVPWSTGAYLIAGLAEHLQDNDKPFNEIIASSAKETKKTSLYSFSYGQSHYNNPLMALILSGKKISLSPKSVNLASTKTQAEAYSEFVSKNKSVFLLGTQRDAIRLSYRENNVDFVMQPLGGYTDLVSYISIFQEARSDSAIKFIEYLLKPEQQQKLSELNMFSTVINTIYASGIMSDMEKTIDTSSVPNAFTDPLIIENTRQDAFKALSGNEEILKKLISNYS